MCMKCHSPEWIDKTEKAAYQAGLRGADTITIFPPGVFQQAWDKGYQEGEQARADRLLRRMRTDGKKAG